MNMLKIDSAKIGQIYQSETLAKRHLKLKIVTECYLAQYVLVTLCTFQQFYVKYFQTSFAEISLLKEL